MTVIMEIIVFTITTMIIIFAIILIIITTVRIFTRWLVRLGRHMVFFSPTDKYHK